MTEMMKIFSFIGIFVCVSVLIGVIGYVFGIISDIVCNRREVRRAKRLNKIGFDSKLNKYIKSINESIKKGDINELYSTVSKFEYDIGIYLHYGSLGLEDEESRV